MVVVKAADPRQTNRLGGAERLDLQALPAGEVSRSGRFQSGTPLRNRGVVASAGDGCDRCLAVRALRTPVAPWDVGRVARGGEADLVESRLLVDWRRVEVPGLFGLVRVPEGATRWSQLVRPGALGREVRCTRGSGVRSSELPPGARVGGPSSQ
jgi:hypothetical protein